jgi:hypothetical protein
MRGGRYSTLLEDARAGYRIEAKAKQEQDAVAYTARLRADRRDADWVRRLDPDADPLLARVWVAYVWRDGAWLLAGFTRRRLRTFTRTQLRRFFRRQRRKLGIAQDETLHLTTLDVAHRLGPPVEPPRRRPSTRPVAIPADLPEPVLTPKQRPLRIRRAKVQPQLNGPGTLVALGAWSDAHWPTYLGPLAAHTKREARSELKQRFGHYPQLKAIPLKELPKGLAKRIRRYQTLPGATLAILLEAL